MREIDVFERSLGLVKHLLENKRNRFELGPQSLHLVGWKSRKQVIQVRVIGSAHCSQAVRFLLCQLADTGNCL